MGNGHPRFFGWVNSAPSAAGVLVAPIAAAMNPIVFVDDSPANVAAALGAGWHAFPFRDAASLRHDLHEAAERLRR